MVLHKETIDFLLFVMLGIIFSFIFDFFRAIRKVKKVSTRAVYIQDIIYFFIVGIIMVLSITSLLKQSFRVYFILSIVLGIFIYIGIFGNKVMMIYIKLINLSGAILEFIILPIKVYIQIFDKQIKKIVKIVINCCKKNIYMINCNYSKIKTKVINKGLFSKVLKKKNKRGNINGKKCC